MSLRTTTHFDHTKHIERYKTFCVKSDRAPTTRPQLLQWVPLRTLPKMACPLGGPYLKLPSCLCLLSISSNSSEASTIPLSVWLSCGERTSQACGPHMRLPCRAAVSQPGRVSRNLSLTGLIPVPMGTALGEWFLVHQNVQRGPHVLHEEEKL